MRTAGLPLTFLPLTRIRRGKSVLGQSAMPSPADEALSGHEVDVTGHHIFEVTTQNIVIAKGKTVMIYPPGNTEVEWFGQDTGPMGKEVGEGYRVFVNKAKVVFR
jgi:hypothetical protein